MRQGVFARLAGLPGPWRAGLAKDAGSLTLPAPPDTQLAREAEELVRELSPPALYGHCLRTWAFATLFGARDQIDHDAELLYLACVLHDIGLTARYNGRDETAACFAVEGARAAHAIVCRRGDSEDRARTVAEAISLHLNINVGDRFGPIATLLHKGVMLDVVGRRLERIPPTNVLEVTRCWPREGSGELLLSDTSRQARLRPDSRAALLHRLGFTKLVLANPVDRL